MWKKFTEASTQRRQRNRTIDASLVTIDLPSVIEQIRNVKPCNDSDRNAITVFKTTGMHIVLMALHKGAEMIKHTADGLIGVLVLEGQMLFNTNEQPIELGKGQIPANEETILLLTLTTTLAENNTGIKATLIWNNIL